MWTTLLLVVAVTAETSYKNHKQFLEEVTPEPTKQGPVLFPNDAPPPPRPPLIVTSRPLIESIARSELNPNPPEINNSIAEPSQINRVSFKPNYLDFEPNNFESNVGSSDFGSNNYAFGSNLKPFLARVKDYRPFAFASGPNVGDYGGNSRLDGGYGDYEEHTPLPPIYKAIAKHAKQKVLKKLKVPKHQHYEIKDRRHDHGSEDYGDDGSNYAFSYTVKDHDTGDDFSHSQQSTGSATNGEYRVRLPDGRMQIVSYTADENGYKADVRYDDEDKTSGNSIDNYDYPAKHDKFDTNNHNFKANKYLPDKVDKNHHIFDVNKYIHDANVNRQRYEQNNQNFDTNIPVNRYDGTDYGAYGKNYDYTDVNHDYIQNRDYKPVKEPESYKKEIYNDYSDVSKEITDYSAEYDGKHDNYEPHKSKFSSFVDSKSTIGTIVVPNINSQLVSTVRPSYDELKPIFVPRKNKQQQNFVSSSTVRPTYEELKPLFVDRNIYNVPNPSAVEINVPSTTSSPNFDTTEHVVVIGAKPLYTNIRHNPGITPTPLTFAPSTSFVSPRNYLVSTIESLKNGEKPVLSDSFINRINKYLSF